MTARYRADHVGSFLRPPDLLEARRDASVEPERLRELEDRHILRVLARQKELGLEVFTDGELRRRNFMSDFTDAVEGFDMGDAVARSWDATQAKPTAVSNVAGVVSGKLRAVRQPDGTRAAVPEGPLPRRLQDDAAERHPVPGDRVQARHHRQGLRGPRRPARRHRRDHEGELQALAAEGVALHPDRRATLQLLPRPEVARVAPDRDRERSAPRCSSRPSRADNACFDAARREGVLLAIHLCRGNNRSHWYAEGGYDAIAETLFGSLRVDRFLLEYDDARSGGFEPLRFVPRGKTVVLGLVSSKQPQLEEPDELVRRVDEASRYVPARAPGAQPAVRLRLDDGGQPHQRGRAVGEAAARGGHGTPDLGLNRARDASARGKLAPHAPQARRLRPTRVPVTHRPGRRAASQRASRRVPRSRDERRLRATWTGRRCARSSRRLPRPASR